MWLALGQPRAEHQLLAEALRASSVVFTPNFDSLIEKATAADGHEVLVSSRLHHAENPNVKARLFKLHGSCPAAILAATEDVLNPVSTPWAAHFVNLCSGADRLVVWGYRGADPDLAPLVVRGAEVAAETIWIVWSEDDATLAQKLLAHVGTAVVECVQSNRAQSIEVAARAVRMAAPHVDRELPRTRPPRPLHFPPHGKASVIAQVGGPSLGRRAWLHSALHGSVRRSAAALSRSVLFDNARINGLVLNAAGQTARWASSPRAWGLVTLAADGHGATADQDAWTEWFRADGLDPWRSERDLATAARMVTVLRRRGRLQQALDVLGHLGSLEERRRRGKPHRPSWEGRLVHEELALHRRREDVDSAGAVLAIAEEWQSLLIGANWMMWIEDEWAGTALSQGDFDAAERHVMRCRELAAAYGSHPLALGAIEIRALEIEIERLLDADCERALSAARERRSDLAPRLRNDHLREIELEGLVAEAARICGDRAAALRHYGALAESPSLLHQLFGAIGTQLSGGSTLAGELLNLVSEVGECPAVDRCLAQSSSAARDVRVFRR